jgi:hypothetical protein
MVRFLEELAIAVGLTAVGRGVGDTADDSSRFDCESSTSIVGFEKVKFLAETKSQPFRSPERVVETFSSLSP